ncbi:MAG TPA: hypothetical protein DCX02_06215 [Firmicutes bacterium]|jgi:hypothetical protein|nr:hypothetical protein [Bacillota bacterium]
MIQKQRLSHFYTAGREETDVNQPGRFSGLTDVRGDGAITIPESVLNQLGLEPDDRLLFQLKGEHIVASKVKEGDKE